MLALHTASIYSKNVFPLDYFMKMYQIMYKVIFLFVLYLTSFRYMRILKEIEPETLNPIILR